MPDKRGFKSIISQAKNKELQAPVFKDGGFNSQVPQMSSFHYATKLSDSKYTFEGVA